MGHWFGRSGTLKFDGQSIKLLDKPDGKVVEESADFIFDWAVFVKAEGDWAYAERTVGNKTYRGWIRGRKDRDLLVRCILNDDKIPDSTSIHDR